jgi:uncharacterized damage-inducible protein DinB
MSLMRPLVDTLKFNDHILGIATSDLNDPLVRRRLRDDGGTSIAWSLGHALQHRVEMARLIGRDLPLDSIDLAKFGRGATTGEEYPTLRDMLSAWTQASAALLTALNGVSDSELLRDQTGLSMPHGERRLLDALEFYVWHETYHLGHIGLLRTHFGLTPLVNLVLAAQPATAS